MVGYCKRDGQLPDLRLVPSPDRLKGEHLLKAIARFDNCRQPLEDLGGSEQRQTAPRVGTVGEGMQRGEQIEAMVDMAVGHDDGAQPAQQRQDARERTRPGLHPHQGVTVLKEVSGAWIAGGRVRAA
jgi:hypothetical protein